MISSFSTKTTAESIGNYLMSNLRMGLQYFQWCETINLDLRRVDRRLTHSDAGTHDGECDA
jgi:hypothetical protein